MVDAQGYVTTGFGLVQGAALGHLCAVMGLHYGPVAMRWSSEDRDWELTDAGRRLMATGLHHYCVLTEVVRGPFLKIAPVQPVGGRCATPAC